MKIKLAAIAAGFTLALAFGVMPAAASSCIGNCGTLGPDGVVPAPPNGDMTYSYVSTYTGVVGAGELAGYGGTDGSELITSPFVATSGEILQFYFDYTTSDGSSTYPDYAFSELLTGGGTHSAYLFTAQTVPGSGDTSPGFDLPANDSTLSPADTPIMAGETTWSPLGPSSGDCYDGPGNGCGTTGWIESTYTIPTAGTYELRFGVTNYGDEDLDSGLAFAGATIGGSPIPISGAPEPSTWLLMFAGVGAAGLMIRQSKRKSDFQPRNTVSI